jgi:hypothetical protein
MTFGGFLVRRGVVTRRQLIAALDEQRRQETRIGKLALRERLLTLEELFLILDAQIDGDSTPFGRLGVAMGLLRPEDVERLLLLQRQSRPRVGEILVELGALTETELENQLRDFEDLRKSPDYEI